MRARKPMSAESNVAESMKQASALWGFSVEAMKIAKAAGCPAFVQSRVYRDDLVKWLDDDENKKRVGEGMAPGNLNDLKCKKLEVDIELQQAKIDKEKRISIPLAEAIEAWGRAVAIFQEEAKGFMEKDHYRVFCERCKTRIGTVIKP